jgi:hypothetical protein
VKNKMKFPILFLCQFFTLSLYAQVIIGSQTVKTEPAALLQVKEYDSSSKSDETAKKGILLPRVKLKSLSDVTVIKSANPNKIADLTGLLVYNVNRIGMEEGFYEWDGKGWNQLGILSNDEGAYTQKALVRTTSLVDSIVPTVSVGRFSFRFSSTKYAQCKLNTVSPTNETVGFHLCRFWDEKIKEKDLGYAYDARLITFPGNSSGWRNLYGSPMTKEERWEVWLADAVKNKVYNVQFIIYTKISPPTYIVLVTEY